MAQARVESEERSELFRATHDERRLASFRRVLTALLVITGGPVVVLGRCDNPTVKHALTVLAVLWLAMFLPMVRLLAVEWRNRRIIERLRARLYARR